MRRRGAIIASKISATRLGVDDEFDLPRDAAVDLDLAERLMHIPLVLAVVCEICVEFHNSWSAFS
jgi:hypothetical protein